MHPILIGLLLALLGTLGMVALVEMVGGLWVSYAVAIGFGMVVGLAEIVSTFRRTPREALFTWWSLLLVLLNGASAALVLALVFLSDEARATPFLTALAVGVGLPTLIRTKFTVAKQFGSGADGDLSLNLGWVYDQFQNLCKTQIDLALMTYRHRLVERLSQRYPDEKTLYQLANHAILTRGGLTDAEVGERQKYLESIVGQLPPPTAKVALPLFILEVGGREYLETLVAAPPTIPPQQIVDGLQARFPTLPELADVVRRAIASAPHLTEPNRIQRAAYLESVTASTDAETSKRSSLILLLSGVRSQEYIAGLLDQ